MILFVLGAYGGLTESILVGVRKWHGSIDEQFSVIDNLAGRR